MGDGYLMTVTSDDSKLLHDYTEDRSEAAFAQIVRRHVDFVYTVALRHVNGNSQQAQDVVQTVFIALARKAQSLRERPVLGGWLYRTTQFAAIDAVRTEMRRQARETESHYMQERSITDDIEPGDFGKVRPLLDLAIGELKEVDRDAVVLRFYNGCSFAEIGGRLRVSEGAARMRVDRAVDKLRGLLERRGIRSTSIALATVLANQPMMAAPTGLAATATAAAMSGPAITWAATIMGMTNLQIASAVAVAVIGVGGYVALTQSNATWRQELAALRNDNLIAAQKQRANFPRPEITLGSDGDDSSAKELDQLRGQADSLRAQLQRSSRSVKVATSSSSPPTFFGTYFEANQVDQQPKPVNQARPFYPPELRQAGITGSVTLDFIVDARGIVRNVTSTATTHPAFASAAIEAFSRWQYEPAQKGSQPVAMHLQVPVYFKLEEDSKQSAGDVSANKSRKTASFLPWF
jgi:RNA polymerase sigma factor (sigma-70 family)